MSGTQQSTEYTLTNNETGELVEPGFSAFVNLTSSPLNICLANKTVMCVPPSGHVARIKEVITEMEPLHNGMISVTRVNHDEVEGLLPPSKDIYYIVSMPIARMIKNRPDVYFPGFVVCNESGEDIGCEGLSQF